MIVRPATPADPVEERYFTLGPKEDAQFRNVVVAEGTFNKRTTVTAVLYIVQSGKVTELDFLSLCRSPNRFGEPHWLTMCINIALNDELKPEGRVTHLGASGQSRAFGGGGVEVAHNFDAVKSRVQSGDLVPGEFRIVYVEGDKESFLERSTTIEEFAQLNAGNYLVVAAGLKP